MSLQQALQSNSHGATFWRMVSKNPDMKALREMIGEAHDVVRTVVLPDNRSRRLYELLSAALQLADHLLETSAAASLGAKGGKVTAQRGPEYFRKIAGMRKERKGGRPSKNVE